MPKPLTPQEKVILEMLYLPPRTPVTLNLVIAKFSAYVRMAGRSGSPKRKVILRILKSLVKKDFLTEEAGFYDLTEAGMEVAKAIAEDPDTGVGVYTRKPN